MYTIYFIDNISKIVAWSFTVDNLELLAGIIAGSVGILDDYNYTINNNNNKIKKDYYLDTDLDISEFRVKQSIIAKETRLYNGNIKPEYYGIWLTSNISFHYDLYKFKTVNFFNGILKICEMLNVDFRRYIYGSPFDYLGREYIDFSIKEIAIDVPERQYEIEEEERGNENVIELLRKDY
jgi:hypothetical protein